MPRPPRDKSNSRVSDTTPRPRPSPGKSGKPPARPREGAAGTPETKHSARGLAEAQAPFLPQIADVAAGVPSPLVGEGQGGGESQTSESGSPPTPNPSPQGGGEAGRARFMVFAPAPKCYTRSIRWVPKMP